MSTVKQTLNKDESVVDILAIKHSEAEQLLQKRKNEHNAKIQDSQSRIDKLKSKIRTLRAQMREVEKQIHETEEEIFDEIANHQNCNCD